MFSADRSRLAFRASLSIDRGHESPDAGASGEIQCFMGWAEYQRLSKAKMKLLAPYFKKLRGLVAADE